MLRYKNMKEYNPFPNHPQLMKLELGRKPTKVSFIPHVCSYSYKLCFPFRILATIFSIIFIVKMQLIYFSDLVFSALLKSLIIFSSILQTI